MEFSVRRTQYCFDLSGVHCKSRKDILVMQRQWDSFERVENYNDVVYQRINAGYRDRFFYQFINRQELSDYKNGQQLHMLRYPWLPSGTFDSISEKPFSSVPVIVSVPIYAQTPKNILFSTSITASEKTEQQSDRAIYMHISTYNSEHMYKYIFTSAEERVAYHRAERQILSSV